MWSTILVYGKTLNVCINLLYKMYVYIKAKKNGSDATATPADVSLSPTYAQQDIIIEN